MRRQRCSASGRTTVYARVRAGTLEAHRVGRPMLVRVPTSPPPQRRPAGAPDATLSTEDVAAMLGVSGSAVRSQTRVGTPVLPAGQDLPLSFGGCSDVLGGEPRRGGRYAVGVVAGYLPTSGSQIDRSGIPTGSGSGSVKLDTSNVGDKTARVPANTVSDKVGLGNVEGFQFSILGPHDAEVGEGRAGRWATPTTWWSTARRSAGAAGPRPAVGGGGSAW